MTWSYLVGRAWHWIADTGLNLAIIIVLAFLVPRAGRLAERIVTKRVEQRDQDNEENKNTLAYAGVIIYVFQIAAFFLLSVAFLQQLGFSLAGAAIPATVASAAIGFGAQRIIADFLAGFFILTEKQYGVGDWVRFVDSGLEVEGTVIQITMRATQIRTLKQETIVVPNSTARISINTSNYWSRAVVVIPVPLTHSKDAQEAWKRAEAATRRALADASITPVLLGELESQPAVNVNPPNTAGMPWTVDMRFMIKVEAGSQWQVERAIRMAILDEFWSEYSTTALLPDGLDHEYGPARPSEDTEEMAAEEPETTVLPVADTEILEEEALAAAQEEQEEEEEPKTKGPKILTLNGRVRASSIILILVLIALLVARVLMLDDETAAGDRVSGPWAPPVPSQVETTEPSPSPPPVTNAPETFPTEEDTPTTVPTQPQTPTPPPTPPQEAPVYETPTPEGYVPPAPQETPATPTPTPATPTPTETEMAPTPTSPLPY